MTRKKKKKKKVEKKIEKSNFQDTEFKNSSTPTISSVFRNFANEYDSSATFSQSNGLAVWAENLLKKAKDAIFGNVVIQNNSNRWHIGLSPAEMNFSPRLKTALPTLGTSGCFNKKDYHKTVGKPLEPTKPGDNIVMQHEKSWKPTTVTEEHHTPRSHV